MNYYLEVVDRISGVRGEFSASDLFGTSLCTLRIRRLFLRFRRAMQAR